MLALVLLAAAMALTILAYAVLEFLKDWIHDIEEGADAFREEPPCCSTLESDSPPEPTTGDPSLPICTCMVEWEPLSFDPADLARGITG